MLLRSLDLAATWQSAGVFKLPRRLQSTVDGTMPVSALRKGKFLGRCLPESGRAGCVSLLVDYWSGPCLEIERSKRKKKEPRSIADMASELATRGFVVLDHVQADAKLLERLRHRSSARLDELLDKIHDAGGDAYETWYMFNEIATRQRMRWDFKMEEDDEVMEQVQAEALKMAAPIVEHLHPPIDGDSRLRPMIGSILISREGAKVQRWHADCDEEHLTRGAEDPEFRMYNLFMPLIDIDKDGDGTEFWPTSHVQPMSFFAGPHPDDPPAGTVEAPACPAGSIIISDFRTLHRGLPNIGRERQVAYFVIGVGEEVEDNVNWCPLGVDAFPPEYFQRLPTWEEYPISLDR